MIYLIVSTILFLLGLGVILWVHSRYQLDIVAEPVSPPAHGPLISVCVPARNEQRNIGRCIQSILDQDYPSFEVIVLDDRSTDATPSILDGLKPLAAQRGKALHILHGTSLPAGWAGKPYALHQAVSAARGEWLCFIDADTFLDPRTLSSVYARALETQADLFTIMTFQLLGSFWEKTVMPLVMTALSVGFSPRKVNDPRTRDAIANGQFILIRRRVYDSIGGHEAIRDLIVEDKAISERVKWNGFRLVVADGSRLASTRMYTSLAEMWEGWTKNVYLGLRETPSMLLLGALGATVSVIAAFLLPVWPLLGIIWLSQGGGLPAALILGEALLLWAILLSARAYVAHRMGLSPIWALTTPLGAAVFAAIMLASAWKVLSGKGVSWKGRQYSVK